MNTMTIPNTLLGKVFTSPKRWQHHSKNKSDCRPSPAQLHGQTASHSDKMQSMDTRRFPRLTVPQLVSLPSQWHTSDAASDYKPVWLSSHKTAANFN